MSKVLATIKLDVPVDYDFDDAKLESVASLYTEDAFVMCKRLEFKNLLGRFNVSAPKINVEEHFTLVTSLEMADKVLAKAKGRDVAYSLVKGAGSTAGKGDSDGQLSLFSQTVTNDYAGLAIAYSDEDVYLILTDDKITSQYINDKVSSLDAKSWIAPDLKANLHVCHNIKVLSPT